MMNNRADPVVGLAKRVLPANVVRTKERDVSKENSNKQDPTLYDRALASGERVRS